MRIWLAVGVIPLLVVAGCADISAREPTAATSKVSPPANITRAMGQERACSPGDLAVGFAPSREGAGGHLISMLEFRNVGRSRCRLSGYPRRATLTEPGRRPVRATNGSFFPARPSRSIEPGEVATLGLETDASCPARPTGGPSGPMYHEVSISIPGGVIRLTTPAGRPLDVACGVHLTKFVIWK